MPREPAHAGRDWRLHAAATTVLLLWIGFCYYGTAASMVAIWARSDTFAHGFFIAPISLWLIWRKRAQLRAATPVVSPLWALPLVLLGVSWWVGDAVSANVVLQFSFVGMLISAVLFMLGWPVARIILFPLLFLLFAVPFGEFLLPLLIEKTADFTVLGLRLTGVPVYRAGNNFQIPSGAWSVVEACSGVRYLIASVTVGTLFAYLNYQSWRRRAVFVVVSIVVPIVANWVRAYIIVMLGHLSGNRIATGVDHLIYGWLFFGIVISIMFAIGARWTEPDAPPKAVAASAATPGHHSNVSALRWIGVALVAGWITVPPALQRLAADRSGKEAAAYAAIGPSALMTGSWHVMPEPPSAFAALTDPAAAGVGLVVYGNDQWTVGLSLQDGPTARSVSRTPDFHPAIDTSEPAATPVAGNLEMRCGNRLVHAVPSTSTMQAAPDEAGEANPLIVWRLQWDDGFTSGLNRWLRLQRAASRLRGKVNDMVALSLVVPQRQPPAALKMFFEENCVAIDAYLRHRRAASPSNIAASQQAGQ